MKLLSGIALIGLLVGLHSASAKSSKRDRIMSSTFSDVFNKKAVPQAASGSIIVREHAKISFRSDVTQQSRVSPETRHQLVFACNQANLDKLEAIVNDVSNPSSQNFGKHMTKAEVNAMTANPASSQHIVRFLEHHGAKIVHRTANDEYITAEAPAGTWETLLQTEFFHFTVQSEVKVSKLVRSLKYSIPQALANHISAVFGAVDFPEHHAHLARDKQPFQPSKEARKSVSDVSSATQPLCLNTPGYACPEVLNYVYDMRSNTGNNFTTQAVFASLDQSMSPSDLTYFQTRFELPLESIAADIGGHVADDACVSDGGNNCLEANLDIQYMMGMSQGVPTTFYYYDLTTDNSWVDWITEVADMADPPKVFSISYGGGEEYLLQSMADSFNTEAMKLAAMGVTIMASSGDDGSPGPSARSSGMACGYAPQFPASCPYVTAVGGTQGPEAGTEEIACQSQLGGVITTGGGFSDLYPRPSWQNDQVNAYLDGVAGTSENPPVGYNAQGRAYPDVSLLAVKYLVASDNGFVVLYGTSASSPFFASMVAQINAQRVAAGKSTLGWINPSLYSLSSSILLNDITSGNNKCAEGGKICCAQGFYARPGWDPVTGVGSVNFTAMSEAFFKLGDEPNVPTLAPTAVSSLSSMPVAAPSIAPSVVPTALPTNTAGWLYANMYTGENCAGTNFQVMGQPTGTCLPMYNEDEELIGARMYSCGADYGTLDYYSASNCDPNYWIGAGTVYLGCTVESMTLGDDDAAVADSQSFMCSNNKDTLYPVYGGAFAMNSSYDAAACGGEVSHFSAIKNDFCIPLSASTSFIFTFPNISVYPYTANCTQEALLLEQMSTDCFAATDFSDHDDGYDDDGYGTTTLSYRVTLYTGHSDAPSPRPSTAPSSHKPTAAPSANNLVYFSASQVINGLDLSTFNSDYATYSTALKLSIAACMNNVVESNIINLVVTSNGNTRVRGQASAGAAPLASTSSISTTYQVNVHDAAESYSSLSSQLAAAVADGTFTAILQSYGDSMGATGFQSASSSSVATSDLEATSSSSSKDSLSGGAIAGIVIGVLAGVVLIGFLVYYCTQSKPAAAAVAEPSAPHEPQVAMHDVTNPIAKKGSTNAV